MNKPLATKDLPEWAQEIVPLDIEGACIVLGVGRTALYGYIKDCANSFEPRGAKKVFYPEHIERLRVWLSNSINETESGKSAELAPMESAFDALAKLATEEKPKNSKLKSKQGSGKVTYMAQKK